MVNNEIQVEPSSEEDYRSMYKFLKHEKIQIHTYELKTEKTLKIVLQRLPQELTEDEIMNDLYERLYPVNKVSHMKNRNAPMPLVLMEISGEYKSIYNTQHTQHCWGQVIKARPYRNQSAVVQCHRCQLFGHIQRNFFSKFKCMKNTPSTSAINQKQHLQNVPTAEAKIY